MFYSFNGMLFYALKINIIWNSYYANQVKKSLRYLLDLLSITISFIFLIASVISNFIKSSSLKIKEHENVYKDKENEF